MAYTDYTYYTDTYKGFAIPQNAFDYYSERASEELQQRVNVDVSEVLATYTNEIQKAVCAIADVLYDEKENGTVTSEKALSYSVSYDVSKKDSVDKSIIKLLYRYLSKTTLLYNGAV